MIDGDFRWKKSIIPDTAKVHDAVRGLQAASIKIVMVVNNSGKLEGTVSDGDIRRALLNGISLSSPVVSVLRRDPLVLPDGVSRELVLKLMRANKIQQIPIINDKNQPIGMHLWDEVSGIPELRSNLMVIMAGGEGKRLRPHTESCPKPMLEVAGKPMLEHIIERGKAEGFTNFVCSLNYMGYMIEDYFQDGSSFGVSIKYIKESSPLGTAGALSLLPREHNLPFVVTNGDVLTDIRYGELLDFHLRYEAMATMAVRLHEIQHPYGVVQMDGVNITGFEEKPIFSTHINAGVYVLSSDALSHLLVNQHCDMPHLFERLQSSGFRTVAYPMHEPWLDVGRPDDLLLANKLTKN
jgi:dTDP-glucose pyrophosphorylase